MDPQFWFGGIVAGALVTWFGTHTRNLREGQRLLCQGLGLVVMAIFAAGAWGV